MLSRRLLLPLVLLIIVVLKSVSLNRLFWCIISFSMEELSLIWSRAPEMTVLLTALLGRLGVEASPASSVCLLIRFLLEFWMSCKWHVLHLLCKVELFWMLKQLLKFSMGGKIFQSLCFRTNWFALLLTDKLSCHKNAIFDFAAVVSLISKLR